MQKQLLPNNSNDDYKVNLEVFEGPLDLLLYLIRKNEIDIYDIPIDTIAEQYAEYLSLMKMLDLNMAGEFLVMAATLSLIKSRMLLPVEDQGDDDDEGEDEKDPRGDLVRQLLAYKRYKDAADALLTYELRQQNVFGPGGGVLVPEEDLHAERPIGEVGLFDLIDAFNDVLSRAKVEPIGEIEPIRWSVPDKIDMILELTADASRIRFSKLFNPDSPRGEIIVTFLALLELLRLRQVTARQESPFTEIEIVRIGPNEANCLPPPVIGGNDHAEPL
ncbi:MAG: segregation and condensation protein A [Kiritimatiellia bacterium]|jgi:segregation and condensation protein A